MLVDNTLYLGNGTGTQYPYISGLAGKMYFNSYDVLTNGALYTFTDRVGNVDPLVLYGTTATNQMVVQGNSNLNGALNVEGNLTQTGSIVQDGGSVTFNNTQNASYDFGVGSLNHLPFMWVDASTDKMAVGGGTPQYTLDVTGDINFTGDLYDDGVLVDLSSQPESYVFSATIHGGKTEHYIRFPSTVYGCAIKNISFSVYIAICSSCDFEYDLGYISSNSFITNSNLYNTPTYTFGTGIATDETTLNSTINSSNNVLEIYPTNNGNDDYIFTTSVIVTCN